MELSATPKHARATLERKFLKDAVVLLLRPCETSSPSEEWIEPDIVLPGNLFPCTNPIEFTRPQEGSP